MQLFRRSSVPRSPRWRFVAALLVLTLVATGVLAWEAWRTAQSRQALVRSALEDHATFAAWQFADRARSKADHLVVSRGLWYVVTRWGGEAARVSSQEEPPASWEERPPFLRYAFSFRLDGRETTGGNASALQIVDGSDPPERIRSWLIGSLPEHARTAYRSEWSYATLAGAPEGESRVVFYTLAPAVDSLPARALGFEVGPEGLPDAFDVAFGYPLLPPSLTRGKPNRQVLSVRVLGPGGDTLYGTEPVYPETFTAREAMSDQWAGLPVEVSLRPDAAGDLLIGGLPSSRMPWLLGLMVLTLLLVVAAIVLLRRESQVARLRTEFVSNVSHELRTPLAQIRMFAETLLLDRVRSAEERTRALEIVDQEARRLTTLVENILLFSRTERGAMHLNPRPTRVGALLREVVDAFRPLAEAREVTVETELEDEVTARADPGAVRQIALNFLDNAVKYGPEGGTVTLGLERSDGTYRIRVDDQGPGVPERERTSVWEAFRRLDGTDEATAGTGIGLSVVRELTLRHGGRTWVEESPGGGARFVAEMPVEPDRVVGAEVAGEDDGSESGGGALAGRPDQEVGI